MSMNSKQLNKFNRLFYSTSCTPKDFKHDVQDIQTIVLTVQQNESVEQK